MNSNYLVLSLHKRPKETCQNVTKQKVKKAKSEQITEEQQIIGHMKSNFKLYIKSFYKHLFRSNKKQVSMGPQLYIFIWVSLFTKQNLREHHSPKTVGGGGGGGFYTFVGGLQFKAPINQLALCFALLYSFINYHKCTKERGL